MGNSGACSTLSHTSTGGLYIGEGCEYGAASRTDNTQCTLPITYHVAHSINRAIVNRIVCQIALNLKILFTVHRAVDGGEFTEANLTEQRKGAVDTIGVNFKCMLQLR